MTWKELLLVEIFQNARAVHALFEDREDADADFDADGLLDEILLITASEEERPLLFIVKCWGRCIHVRDRPSVRLEVKIGSGSAKAEFHRCMESVQKGLIKYGVMAVSEPDMLDMTQDEAIHELFGLLLPSTAVPPFASVCQSGRRGHKLRALPPLFTGLHSSYSNTHRSCCSRWPNNICYSCDFRAFAAITSIYCRFLDSTRACQGRWKFTQPRGAAERSHGTNGSSNGRLWGQCGIQCARHLTSSWRRTAPPTPAERPSWHHSPHQSPQRPMQHQSGERPASRTAHVDGLHNPTHSAC